MIKKEIFRQNFVKMFGLTGRYSRKPGVLLQVTISGGNFGIG
jgi:hypothetical protein